MARPSHLRSARRLTRLAILAAGLAWTNAAPAQTGPLLPSFAWPPRATEEGSRWAGSYAAMSAGFAVSSSKRFGSSAGPTIGFEGGRMWEDDGLVYGLVGGFDYLAARGAVTPGFGGFAYSRDFTGGFQAKVGTLVTPDVLVYAKVGAAAVNERFRFGPAAISPWREDLVVRPDARVGAEWAITDRLSVAVEAGVTGRGLR